MLSVLSCWETITKTLTYYYFVATYYCLVVCVCISFSFKQSWTGVTKLTDPSSLYADSPTLQLWAVAPRPLLDLAQRMNPWKLFSDSPSKPLHTIHVHFSNQPFFPFWRVSGYIIGLTINTNDVTLPLESWNTAAQMGLVSNATPVFTTQPCSDLDLRKVHQYFLVQLGILVVLHRLWTQPWEAFVDTATRARHLLATHLSLGTCIHIRWMQPRAGRQQEHEISVSTHWEWMGGQCIARPS